ncbi:MAG: primosomal protein N' [Bacillota bacterium]
MFAEVVVEHPAARVAKPFHYSVPEHLRASVRAGSAVVVPFGTRTATGYVIGFVDKPDVPKVKVKDILGLASGAAPLSQELMDLANWMTARYLCRPSEAFAQMFPVAVRRGRASIKMQTRVELAVSSQEAEAFVAQVERRAPRQAQVVRALIKRSLSASGGELQAVPETGSQVVRALIRKGILSARRVEVMRSPVPVSPAGARPLFRLTHDQSRAVAIILAGFEKPHPKPVLLHGVTASGKTEVYIRAIEAAVKRGMGAILLVPEISLTPQVVRSFQEKFGRTIALLHSRLSLGERYDEWRRVEKGEARVIIGARSAVFAPVASLGLVIVDEEHENSYKQEESPRYHAREVARERARTAGCPCVFGSATPSVESFHRALTGEYEYVELPQRIDNRAMPTVEVVDMREELASGNKSIFSRSLARAIGARLAIGEQTILFLNRRGHSTFVLCRECGHALRCPECDVALTYHAEVSTMRCHYCGHEDAVPDICPKCESRYIKYFGAGTERIEGEVRRVFPQARVVRMDLDTTRRKGAHEAIVGGFARGDYDILVGTQMVAKGHDFPRVTLVGVVSADTCLNLPDFKAGERTFQLLTQVAGRAGRGAAPGHVIIQTYAPEHYAVQRARFHDYKGFYEEEIRARREALYPPFVHLVMVVTSGEDPGQVERYAQTLSSAFREEVKSQVRWKDIRVLGPAPCPMRRVRRMYRWQVLLKGAHVADVNDLVRYVLRAYPPAWRDVTVYADVDPESTL